MRYLFLSFLCVAVAPVDEALGQPDWFESPPSPTSMVRFVAGAGTGETQTQAQRSAYRGALTREARLDSAQVTLRLSEEVREALEKRIGSGLEGRVAEKVVRDLEVDGQTAWIPGLRPIARTYGEGPNGEHRAWTLFAVPRRPGLEKQQVGNHLARLRDQRRTSIRLRSIVPGWAQAAKGQDKKGIAFATGVALLSVTAVVAKAKEIQLAEQAASAPSGPQNRTYRNRASRWQTGFFTASSAAAGTWLWNVIDAWTTDSEDDPLFSRVEVQPASSEPGLSIAVRF